MVTYQENPIHRVKKVYGGELSEDEITFLTTIQEIFTQVIDTGQGFNESVEIVTHSLLETLKINFNENLVENRDMYNFIKNRSTRFKNQRNNSITESEISFSKEVIKAIDFVMKNGIGFGLIINVLCHDFLEIKTKQTLDEALNNGFSPKVSGWAGLVENDFGDPDEPEA